MRPVSWAVNQVRDLFRLFKMAAESPPVVRTLLLLCTLVYIYEVIRAGFLPTPQQLYDLGGITPYDWTQITQWWRAITSNFLHANFVHYGNNMLALLYMGPLVEKKIGSRMMLLLVFVACIGSSIGAVIGVDDTTVIVGISGVIAATIGFGVAADPHGKTPLGIIARLFLVINVVYAFFAHGLSTGGHLGGLLVGLVAGWLFRTKPYQGDPSAEG